MIVDPESPLVKELLGDSVSVAKLVEDFGKMSVVLMAQLIDQMRRDMSAQAADIGRLKLKIEGLEQAERRLVQQLKTRFEAVDSRVGKLEKR